MDITRSDEQILENDIVVCRQSPTPVSVFLQPAGPANVAAGFSVPGPSDGVDVVPPFRVNPGSVSTGLKNLGGTYLPGTGHSWSGIHKAWNEGQYDKWAVQQGPIAGIYLGVFFGRGLNGFNRWV